MVRAGDAAHKVSQDGFHPTDLARVEQLHQLLRVVLWQHRTRDVRRLEEPEIGHDLAAVPGVASAAASGFVMRVGKNSISLVPTVTEAVT